VARSTVSYLQNLQCQSGLLHHAQNKMHINDWSAIQTLFDKLNKQLEKSMKVRPNICMWLA
jgi:hypothetical protein